MVATYSTPEETLWQASIKTYRRRLRLALNRAHKTHLPADWRRVVKVVNEGMTYFAESGYPDWWADFQRAEDDAYWAMRTRTFL